MAHNFNNNLAIIRGNLELALRRLNNLEQLPASSFCLKPLDMGTLVRTVRQGLDQAQRGIAAGVGEAAGRG